MDRQERVPCQGASETVQNVEIGTSEETGSGAHPQKAMLVLPVH